MFWKVNAASSASPAASPPPKKATKPPANFDAQKKRVRDRALGALIGVSIGDSIGSYMEFQHDAAYSNHPVLPSTERVREALRMPGNGPPHFLAPGQVTDDVEMALALASVLKGKNPRDGFPKREAWSAYHAWIKSNPFDVGVSTRDAFGPSNSSKSLVNPRNESNGCLMRISPLAVWARNLQDGDIARLAGSETSLSHSSPVARVATAAYVITLASLVRGEGPSVARRRALDWLKTVKNPVSARKVRSWIVAESDPSNSNSMKSAGWIKHAFRLAFFHLKRRSTFRSALRHTLLTGGDTDTNAAIVGAMIGARDGFASLPPLWKRRVLTSDTNRGKHPRPSLYHPANFVSFANVTIR
jgi:ADP-ribosylglycohydrolase